MKKKSLLTNSILNGSRNILNLLFPLITFPYVSRVLSVNGIGKFNFASSIINYYILFAALGIDKYAIREGSKFKNDHIKLEKFASEVFSINIFSTVLSYIFLILTMVLIKHLYSYDLAISIFGIQIIFITIGTEWIYSILEDYAYITIRSILFKLVSIGLLFIFVRTSDDYIKYCLITVFATVGSNIFNYFHLKKFFKIKFTLDIQWKEKLIPILIIFISNIAIQIYVNSDLTMLGFLSTDYTVGIYSVSSKIYSIIKSTIASILIVTIPRLSYYMGNKRLSEYNKLMNKLTNILLIVTIPIVIGGIILSNETILLISGVKYISASNSLCILYVALLFSIFSWVINSCVLIPNNQETDSMISSIISAVLNVTLNFLFIPLFQEVGSAITTVIAEMTMLGFNIYFSKGTLKSIYKYSDCLKNIISIFAGCVLVALICLLFKQCIPNLILKLFASLTVSPIVYGLVLIAFKNEYISELLLRLKTLYK